MLRGINFKSFLSCFFFPHSKLTTTPISSERETWVSIYMRISAIDETSKLERGVWNRPTLNQADDHRNWSYGVRWNRFDTIVPVVGMRRVHVLTSTCGWGSHITRITPVERKKIVASTSTINSETKMRPQGSTNTTDNVRVPEVAATE